MLGILRFQESALVMVEPPGQSRRTRIFEINDGIHIAIKDAVLERLRSLMGHSGVRELRKRLDSLPIKAGKDRGGGSAIETFVVKTNANLQLFLSVRCYRTCKSPQKRKSIKMAGPFALVNSEPAGCATRSQ